MNRWINSSRLAQEWESVSELNQTSENWKLTCLRFFIHNRFPVSFFRHILVFKSYSPEDMDRDHALAECDKKEKYFAQETTLALFMFQRLWRAAVYSLGCLDLTRWSVSGEMTTQLRWYRVDSKKNVVNRKTMRECVCSSEI